MVLPTDCHQEHQATKLTWVSLAWGSGFRPKRKNDSVRTALGLEVREPYMISPELRLKEPERWRPDEDGVRLPEILPKLILVEALAGGPSAGGTLGPHLFVSL